MSEVLQLRPQTDRQRFLGGSDAAAVLGVSPWSTPLDIYLEKTGHAENEFDPAREKLFRRGKLLEPVALQMLVEDYALKVTKVSTPANPNRHVDPEHAFLACEVDFEWEVTQADIERWNLAPELLGTIQSGEIKTVHHFAGAKFGDAETEEVPIEYAAQAMAGLMVTGRKLCLFGVLLGADNLTPYFVHRDDETIAAMRPKLVSFWRDHVLTRVPPEPIRLPDVLKLLGMQRRPIVVEADELLFRLACDLDAAKAEERTAKERIDELKFDIGKRMLGEAAIERAQKKNGTFEPPRPTDAALDKKHMLKWEGEPVLTIALQQQTRIDSDAVRKKHPEVAIECSKETKFFIFREPTKNERLLG